MGVKHGAAVYLIDLRYVCISKLGNSLISKKCCAAILNYMNPSTSPSK